MRNGRGSTSPVAILSIGREQLGNAFAAPCRGGNDRNAEFVSQLGRVDTDAPTPGLVHQIEADDHSIGDLEHLDHQVEVALETGRVDHDDGDVGAPEEEEVARDLLVGAAGLQGVGPGQVDELDPLPFVRRRCPRRGPRSCRASSRYAAGARSER